MIVLMRYKKSTVNTYVYEEIDNNGDTTPKIPTLYIRKSAFIGNTFPKNISITIEVDHD